MNTTIMNTTPFYEWIYSLNTDDYSAGPVHMCERKEDNSLGSGSHCADPCSCKWLSASPLDGGTKDGKMGWKEKGKDRSAHSFTAI